LEQQIHRIIIVIILQYSAICTADTPVIAAASNLTAPLTEIARQYEAVSGNSIRLSFGSSGNLARQIVQGAPYRLFISASYDYIDFLLSEGAIDNEGTELVQGQIVVFIPEQSILKDATDLRSVVTHLQYRDYRKIAFANPEIAPYGVAALQAFQSAGFWAIETNRTLLADSVAQVMQFALSGNVDVAVIPYSFMLDSNFQHKGKYFLIPSHWHMPISQYVVLLRNADQTTRDFMEFLFSDTAHAIFGQYGYNFADE